MKKYLVVHMTEGGERGSIGSGEEYETYDMVKYTNDEIAKEKIAEYYGIDGVRVYKLSKLLRLKK